MRRLAYLFVSLSFFGCYSHINEEEPCVPLALDEIRYASEVYPIIGTSCAILECHTSGFEHGNFNDFTNVKEKAESGILEFMIATDQMPHGASPGPKYLTECEILTIKKWINKGSQNN